MTFDPFGQLFAVDNDPDSRPPCRLLHIVEGGDYGYRFRNGRQGPASLHGLERRAAGHAGHGRRHRRGARAASSPTRRTTCPADYRGTLLVTSWGDHRIERYDPQPHGASFRATMKPVVVGGDDFRPVGIAVAPDGAALRQRLGR